MAAPAMADSGKWFYWQWSPFHFKNLDFERRHLNDAKFPHNRQWDKETWVPEAWISQREDGLALIDGFYKADILEDQIVKDGIPYLYVGPQFYTLSGYDKKRLAETIDAVYGVTKSGDNEVFILYDGAQNYTIGMYTKNGLQLQ